MQIKIMYSNKLNIETGYRVESFHSKKEYKEEILQNFINNYIDIIVSTTAFGMGVDKPDIESVIHFASSQNIEDYMQESGRAGRDEKIFNKYRIYITPVDLAIKSKLSIDVNNNEYEHKLDDIIAELVEEGLIERETNIFNKKNNKKEKGII
ncbi:helicase-related protein [Lebetimonas sp. JH292]|uniref:helicase-related protein n=1 Tax=Lebetimonas sp. JH292 TaxID=990068 RepID=UPI0004661572|nr:helicase-related protein [Lebetimonas sp. JH292]